MEFVHSFFEQLMFLRTSYSLASMPNAVFAASNSRQILGSPGAFNQNRMGKDSQQPHKQTDRGYVKG